MDKNTTFEVDTSFTGYVFVGGQYGKFKAQSGDMVEYCNMFVLCQPADASENHHPFGLKADKLKCTSPAAFEGLQPGDRLRVFFDKYGRVQTVDIYE